MFLRTAIVALLVMVEGSGRTHAVVFEKNRGQAPADVRYLLRTTEYPLDFKRGEVVLHVKTESLRIRFAGPVNKPVPEGHARLDGLIRYLDSNGPDKNEVPTFASIKYESLYSGIDLAFYGRKSKLESYFIVAPGADPQQMRIAIEGAERIELDDAGGLGIHLAGEILRVHRLRAWQLAGSGRQPVDIRYQLSELNEIRFFVGDYDHSLPLTIG